MHAGEGKRGRTESDSYIEVRLVATVTLAVFLLAIVLPLMLADDWVGDNLSDAWKEQYGLSTNIYDATNLVGWWQLNGTNNTDQATDRSGNGINGTLNGFPSIAYGPGLFDNALYFTTNGTVTFPTTNSILNTATNQFTFSAWFQTTNTATIPATIATWSDAANNSWSITTGTNGVASIVFSDTTYGAQAVGTSTNEIPLYDGNWHQLVATYSSTNQEATVYVDGGTQARGTITNWASGPVASFTFGVSNTNTLNQPYVLDEVRLYNRAFGYNEIDQLPYTYSDLNGSGLTVYDDYLEGFNPVATYGIITSGFINSGLTGYYGDNVPTLAKTGGDGQTVAASTFEANPLVVHVKNGAGSPLVNAPITFVIPSGSDGGLSLTNSGATTTSLSLTTDTNGNATVYYASGTDAMKNNTITATAVAVTGSASVSFTAYCGVQNGLVAWYRADAGVSTDTNGNVTGWTDQTGNYPVAPYSGSYEPTYVNSDSLGQDEPAVRFNGSQYLESGATVGGVNNDMTMIVVGSVTNAGNWQGAVEVGGEISYVTGARAAGFYGGYPSFMNFVTQKEATVAATANRFACETMTLGTNEETVTFYQNGVAAGTASFSSASGPVVAGLRIGSYGPTTSPSGQWNYWTGDIAEVLIYNHQLSTSDMNTVGGYLADKYGMYNPNSTWPLTYSGDVQTLITDNQWNRSQAEAYVNFLDTYTDSSNSAMPVDGLVAWYKADDGVTSDTNGNVTEWADQTGNYPLMPYSSSYEPTILSSDTTSNGRATLRFNGSQYLSSAATVGGVNNDMTMIVVGSVTNAGNWQGAAEVGGLINYVTGARAAGYYGGYPSFMNMVTQKEATVGATANRFACEAMTLGTNEETVSFYHNGVAAGTASFSSASGPVVAGLRIGSYGTGLSPSGQWDYWAGDIAEVLVYDHQLSTSDMNKVGGYLADKYGMYNPNSTWPTAYNSDVQMLITDNQWNESQTESYVQSLSTSTSNDPTMPVDGLVAWYKADDGVTTDTNGNVTEWADQTGNYPVTPYSSSYEPTFLRSDVTSNSNATLRFNGSQYLESGATVGGVNNDMTMIVVGSVTNAGNWQGAVEVGGEISYVTGARAAGYYGGDLSFMDIAGLEDATVGGTANRFACEAMKLGTNEETVSFYHNGVAAGTATFGSPLGPVVAGLKIGSYGTTSSPSGQWNYWTGDIAEVLIYDHQLSTSDMNAAGVYLADKYGMYNPNSNWAMSYNSDVQMLITDNQWNESQTAAYVEFLGNYSDTTMVVDGLVAWYRADDGVTTDTNENVTEWADQTGNYPVTPYSSSYEPTFLSSDATSNGRATLRFNGSQYLSSAATVGGVNHDMTMILVGSVTNPDNPQSAVSIGSEVSGVIASRGAGYGGNSYGYPAFFTMDTYDNATVGTTANRFACEAITLGTNEETVTFYHNGEPAGTAAFGSPLGPVMPGLTIGSYSTYWGNPSDEWNHWTGDIAEVLVYDHQLSTSDMNAVQGYLADKYGMYNPNSTWPTAYNSDVQMLIADYKWNKSQTEAFLATPAAISGLALWLEADAGVTSSSNNVVTAWADQTGNYILTPTTTNDGPTYVANDSNGAAALRFNGSQWLYNSSNINLNADLTIITVGMTTAPSSNEISAWLGTTTPHYGRGLGYDSNQEYFDTSGTPVYAPEGPAPAPGTFVSDEATLNSTLTTVTFYRNGTGTGSNSLSGAETLPAGISVGTANNGAGANWQGDIAEVLVYNHQLSSDELTEVDGYLADKYGYYSANETWSEGYSSEVQGLISTYQWSESQANFYVANPGVMPEGLLMWLKADAGVTSNSNNVTAWADQMGNYTLTQTTTNSEPTYVSGVSNGKPALHFAAGQVLTSSSSMGSEVDGALTMILVEGITTPVPQQTPLFLGNGSYYQNRTMGYYEGDQIFNFWGDYCLGAAAPDADNRLFAEETMLDSSLTGVTFYRNGVETIAKSISGGQNVTPGIQVGNLSNGYIAEVLIYDHQLASGELMQVDGYLADKYGYNSPNATWPSEFSGDIRDLISTYQWDEDQTNAYVAFSETDPPVPAVGLQLWLRADVGVTSSNNNVSEWADQGPAQQNAIQTNTDNQPQVVSNVINGKPVVRFNGSGSYLNLAAGFADFSSGVTAFAVFTPTNMGSWQRIFDIGNGAPGDNILLARDSTGSAFNFNALVGTGYSYQDSVSGGDSRISLPQEFTGILNGSNSVTLFQNGTQVGQNTSGLTTLNNIYRSSNYIGKSNWGDAPYQGDMAELLIYNRPLSSGEQEQVEVYLADKYGLYHPHANWPEDGDYSSDVQTLITTNQWNKSQADAYVTLVSNGLVPASGLALWLAADEGVTADSGGNVSHWQDQSPNQDIAGQLTSGIQPTLVSNSIFGKPVIHFNSSAGQCMSIPDNSNLNISNYTILMVINPGSSSNYQDIISKPYYSDHWANPYASYLFSITPGGLPYFGGANSSSVWNSAYGSIPIASQGPIVVEGTYGNDANQYFAQGILQTSNTVSSSPLAYGSGSDLILGTCTDPNLSTYNQYYNGDIAEILVYNRVLTSEELVQADGYLADKYGFYDINATWPGTFGPDVLTEIILHQWNETQAENYVYMQEHNTDLPTDGLTLWLEAAAAVTNSSNDVTSIADETGNYTLSQTATTNEPTYVAGDINGEPALRFNGNQWLASSSRTLAPGLNQDMTVITVGMTINPDTQTYSLYLGQNNGTAGINRAFGYEGDEFFDTADSSALGGAFPDYGTFVAETATLNSALTTVTFYQNGVETGTNSLSGVENLSPDITFGAAGGGTSGWQGDIAEVLVYDHQLTSTELQGVGAYLANKYNLPFEGTAPTISPNGGSYGSTETVSISSNQSTGTLRYTLDGTTPTAGSPAYTSPLSLPSSALVQAAVFLSTGAQISQVASAQFYIDDSGDTGLPPAPTGLTVTAVSPTEIDLSWSLASLLTYSQVYVYRSTDGGSYELIAVLGPGATCFADTTVTAGNSYTYKVGTLNQAGISDTSASSSVSPSSASTLTITVTSPSGAVPVP